MSHNAIVISPYYVRVACAHVLRFVVSHAARQMSAE